jgi:hypothetical protein
VFHRALSSKISLCVDFHVLASVSAVAMDPVAGCH